MGILSDTLNDALRPLPAPGSWLRRSQDLHIEAAPLELEEPDDEGGALTLYRLQKDGGGGLPAVPSDPRVGDAGLFWQDPLPAPAVNLREHDASPRADSRKPVIQERAPPLENEHRPERSVAPEPIHPSEDVGSSGPHTDWNPVATILEGVTHPVEPNEGKENARRATGRGTPSGDLYRARGPREPAPFPMQSSDPMPGYPAGSFAEPQAGLDSGPGPVSAASRLDAAAGEAPPQTRASADPGPRPAVGLKSPARATPGEAHPQQGRFSPLPAGAKAAGAPPPPASTEPAARLHIGRIEVVVVAPAQPEHRATAWGDDGFLSRNYLRGL